jgi:sugar O-acyltransferase (sialic acid O-acetyltransferase NeuD family)
MADTQSNKLFILGAGGFGRELLSWIRYYALPFEFAGFLDNQKSGDGIVGRIDDHHPRKGNRYIAALGAPDDRKATTSQIEAAGGRFTNIVSPYVMLASPLPEDSGVVVLGNASVGNDVQISRHTLIQGFSVIGHEITVGAYSTVSSFVFIGGGARIGASVTIHPHATILPKVSVGEGAIVGAGSVVTRTVQPHTTVFGNPAKLLLVRRKP